MSRSGGATAWLVASLGLGFGLALAMAAAGGCRGGAPDRAPPPERPATERPPAPAPRFDPARIDLGVVAPGVRLERSVPLRNETSRSIRLVSVEAPCECTTADLTLPLELRADETIDVPLVLDLSVLTLGGAPRAGEPSPKPLERQVTIVTSEGARAQLDVALAVSDAVLVEPATLGWPGASANSPLVGQVTVRSGRAGTELALEQVVSRGSPPPEVERHDEDGAAVLTVTWGPFDGTGERRGSLLLVTGDPELPSVEIPLRADILGPVVVQPAEILREAAVPSRPVVETLILRRRDGEPVRVLSAKCNEHRVRVQVSATEPHVPEARVQVVVPVLPHPREVTGTVEIITDVPGGTVRVPIRVRAAAP